MATRTAESVAVSIRPTTPRRTRSGTGCAPTAAALTTARASSGRPSTRPTSRSVKARGRRSSRRRPPTTPGASIRTKYGLPRVRRDTSAASSGVTGPAPVAARSSATSSGVNGSSPTRSTDGSRPSSLSSCRTRGRAARPSVRTVTTTARRSENMRLSRNLTNADEDASAHCRSSMTTITGPRRPPSSPSRVAKASKRRSGLDSSAPSPLAAFGSVSVATSGERSNTADTSASSAVAARIARARSTIAR